MLETLVRLAGVGQVVLATASLAIPHVLSWREETARLRPLLRQLFWIYAGYIVTTYFALGLLSALAPRLLLDGSPLAAAVSGFATVWWGSRLALQWVFDRSDVPKGPLYRLAEASLVSLFVFLTATYGAALVTNLGR